MSLCVAIRGNLSSIDRYEGAKRIATKESITNFSITISRYVCVLPLGNTFVQFHTCDCRHARTYVFACIWFSERRREFRALDSSDMQILVVTPTLSALTQMLTCLENREMSCDYARFTMSPIQCKHKILAVLSKRKSLRDYICSSQRRKIDAFWEFFFRKVVK